MTVLTVSLLMVIVLTFSVQVQMDMKAARNAMAKEKARASARLAVELAIAKLQETAGPDQRVTAVADILEPAHLSNGSFPPRTKPLCRLLAM